MFLLHHPTASEVRRFVAASRYLPLSYGPIGLAREGAPGYDVDEATAVVGNGQPAFARAKTALMQWRHVDLGWVELFPERSPIIPGTVVAVLVRHVGLWSLNGCRIVYHLSASGDPEFGFAYGTLTNHAECGEEIFRVALDPRTGNVSYGIRAVSRPRAALARIGYPVARSIQARFRRDSAAALARAVSDSCGSGSNGPQESP